MSVIIDGTSGIAATGALTGLTTPLAVGQGGTGLSAAGTSGNVLKSDGTNWVSTAVSAGYRTKALFSGTTYTLPSDVSAIYVFVHGATGGTTAGSGFGARGGAGYSEKYYATPAASYSYSIGAAGANTGTAGGTTTFGVMSVTGGSGVTSSAGSAGGVGSGGDFNATGGTGGAGNGSTTWGGVGGAGSRAGNGGNGGAAGASLGGGGGGTGGNNASTSTGGTYATAKSVSALTLPFGQSVEFFDGGGTSTTAAGQIGASSTTYFDGTNPTAGVMANPISNSIPTTNANLFSNGFGVRLSQFGGVAAVGNAGSIIIVEVLK